MKQFANEKEGPKKKSFGGLDHGVQNARQDKKSHEFGGFGSAGGNGYANPMEAAQFGHPGAIAMLQSGGARLERKGPRPIPGHLVVKAQRLLGVDLSGVTLEEDASLAEQGKRGVAEDGQRIRLAPQAVGDMELIWHEIVHLVQQRGAKQQGDGQITDSTGDKVVHTSSESGVARGVAAVPSESSTQSGTESPTVDAKPARPELAPSQGACSELGSSTDPETEADAGAKILAAGQPFEIRAHETRPLYDEAPNREPQEPGTSGASGTAVAASDKQTSSLGSAGPRNDVVDGAERVEGFQTHRLALAKGLEEDTVHIRSLLESRLKPLTVGSSPSYDELVERNTCEFILNYDFQVLFPLYNGNVNLNEGSPVWFWVGSTDRLEKHERGLKGSFNPSTKLMLFRRTLNFLILQQKSDKELLETARHEVQHFADQHTYAGNNVGWEDSLERVKTEFRGRISGGKTQNDLGSHQLKGDEGLVSVISEFGLEDTLANRILTDILINYPRKENNEDLLSLYRRDEAFRKECNSFAEQYRNTPLEGPDRANPEGFNPSNSIRIHKLLEFIDEHWTGVEYIFGAEKPYKDLEERIAALDSTDRAIVCQSQAWKTYIRERMFDDSSRFWGALK